MGIQHLLLLIAHYSNQHLTASLPAEEGSRSLQGTALRNQKRTDKSWFFMGECIGQSHNRLGRDNCPYKQVSFSSSRVQFLSMEISGRENQDWEQGNKSMRYSWSVSPVREPPRLKTSRQQTVVAYKEKCCLLHWM